MRAGCHRRTLKLAGPDGLADGHFATFPISLAARGVQADLRAGPGCRCGCDGAGRRSITWILMPATRIASWPAWLVGLMLPRVLPTRAARLSAAHRVTS